MNQRTITVTGIGKVAASPDTVEVSFVIRSDDLEYGKTVGIAAQKYNVMEAELLKLGFDKEDIKTSDYDISSYYNSVRKNGESKQVFAGYRCRQHVVLRFPLDPARLSDIIGSIASSVADPELNVRFTVKDVDGLKDEIIRSACENAMRSARVLAQAMGVELGELESISYVRNVINVYSDTSYRAFGVLAEVADYSAPQFTPDDIDLEDSAVFVWKIV